MVNTLLARGQNNALPVHAIERVDVDKLDEKVFFDVRNSMESIGAPVKGYRHDYFDLQVEDVNSSITVSKHLTLIKKICTINDSKCFSNIMISYQNTHSFGF